MGPRGHNQKKRVPPQSEDATARHVRALIAACESPARVLELCYWSREPGLIEIIRGIAAMPEQARAALEAFVALSHEPKSVVATLDRRGVLTLTSAQAARALTLASFAAEDDGESRPRLLN